MSFASRTTTVFAVAFMALSVATPAFGQLRIMNYNCAHMGGDGPAFQQVLTAAHSDNKAGWAKPVDIFIFQEVSSSTVAELQSLVNAAAPAGTTYSRATFTTSGTEDSAAGSQCAFYRVQTITEATASHADIYTGASRNADRWLFRLNGYSSTAAQLYAYSMHLKASVGFEADRRTGALAVRANADSLGAGVPAILSATLMCTTIQSLHISLSWQVEMRKPSTLLELVRGAEVPTQSFIHKVHAT